jgi:hypothetical protein
MFDTWRKKRLDQSVSALELPRHRHPAAEAAASRARDEVQRQYQNMLAKLPVMAHLAPTFVKDVCHLIWLAGQTYEVDVLASTGIGERSVTAKFRKRINSLAARIEKCYGPH